jgi:hypothetical protein
VGLGLVFAAQDDVILAVAELDASLEAVEQRRRDGDIAFGREAVGNVADVDVDAENFLNDDNARPQPLM